MKNNDQFANPGFSRQEDFTREALSKLIDAINALTTAFSGASPLYVDPQTATGLSNVSGTLIHTPAGGTASNIMVFVAGSLQTPGSAYTYDPVTNKVTHTGALIPAGTKIRYCYIYIV